jgi:DNA-binding response OmpR family regulator
MKPDSGGVEDPASILIVDDERDNREFLQIVLAREGFLIRTAASGEEALTAVAQQPPDLILLDLMMPGMNGCEVATKLKGDVATKHIRLAIVSALDDHKTRTLVQAAGADDFFTKPMGRAEVCQRVRDLLSRAGN